MWMIAQSIDYFFKVLYFLIMARILLSWINPNPYGTISRMLYQLTEPLMAPARNLLYRLGLGGTIDFSPILTIFILDMIRSVILGLL